MNNCLYALGSSLKDVHSDGGGWFTQIRTNADKGEG